MAWMSQSTYCNLVLAARVALFVAIGRSSSCARLAVRGWNVLFLSNPVSPLHFIKWQDQDIRRPAAAGHYAQGHNQIEPSGLNTALPLTLLPFVRRIGAGSRWMIDHWPKYTLPNLKRTLRRAGFDRPETARPRRANRGPAGRRAATPSAACCASSTA